MSGGDTFAVAELVPHTGSMLLLERILSVSDTGLSAELQVRGDGWLLGDQQSVPAWTGIEYMAQAVAAYAGWQACAAGQPIRLGFLLGTRHFRSNVAEFAVGSRLTVTVEKIIQDEQLGVFDCRISGDNVELVAKLNVYQPAHAIDSKPL